MTLVDFLLARIAEDEGVAQECLSTHEPGEPWGYSHLPDDGQHISRWSPARVLAECEAKRRIVALEVEWLTEMRAALDKLPGLRAGSLILAILALPYADHEDYREEWRP